MHYPVLLVIRYQTSQNKSSDCLNKRYRFLGSQCLIKHHNSLFQQPHLRQALDVPNRRPCKDIGLYRVPLRQPDDLRCAGCKVKFDLSTFAVVVYLIQVDSGGYFCSFCGTRSASASRYGQARFPAASGATCQAFAGRNAPRTGGCTLGIHRQVLKGRLRGQRADASTGHADGIPLFQIKGRWRLETVQDMRSSSSNPVSGSETSIKSYGSKEEIRARKARKRLMRLTLRQTHLYR